MKKIILSGIALVAGLVSCTEDYTNWGTPQSNAANDPQTFVLTVQPTASSIDFATYTEETIQLFTSNLAEGQTEGYTITVSADDVDGTKELQADAEGKAKVEDIKNIIIAMYGNAPTQRNLTMAVQAVVKNISTSEGTIAALAKASPYTQSFKLDAPFIDEGGYYVVGNIDGWTCKRVDKYHLVNNGGNVYDNPEFTVELEPVDGITTYEIKMIPASDFNEDGSIKTWDRALSAMPNVWEPAYEGSYSNQNWGDNIKFDAVEGAKKYTITINAMETYYKVEALSFEPFVYFIGATDGWTNAEQRLALIDKNTGFYSGFVYCADPNGWGNKFKFQKKAGDWNTQINAESVTISGDFESAGDNDKNFTVTKGEGVYYVTLDLTNNTINAAKIDNMNLVGSFNGWNPSDDTQQMTWNSTDYCFEITGAGVDASGWKFTANNKWTINLGGDVADLTVDGGNLSVVGSTIKLYPTRKTSKGIYCTVQ